MIDTPMTWESYINFRIAAWAVCTVLALIGAVIKAVAQWRDDCHVNDESDPNELPAGKTLGL
jgi:hypothetical protein